MDRISSVAGYADLRSKIKTTLVLGQQKIEEAKVLTYWKTGQLIDQHIRGHTPEGKERAAYNTKVVEQLTKDLKISDTVLYRCVRFAQQFKKVAARPLSWAHYRALITVPDEKKRLGLADQAAKEEWSSRDLEIEVRNFLWAGRVEASDGRAPSLLTAPTLGPFFTYRIIRPEIIHSRSNELLLDLGFSVTIETNRLSDVAFTPDTIVTSSKDSKGRYTLKETRSSVSKTGSQKGAVSPESLLYTYQSFVERVIDGDTLKVEIDLGFNTRIRQTIRLKALDCPEMDTAEGKAAKRFVETALQGLEYITLKTIKSDKYDRYLGDVFLPARSLKASAGGTGATGPECNSDKAEKQQYLNNMLLEKGHAVRVRE